MKKNTALHFAAKKGDFATVKSLIEGGTDIETETDLLYTPLFEATVHQHVIIIEYLLAHGAIVNRKNLMGEAPLHLAASPDYPADIAKALLEHGARTDTMDAAGESPLHWAANTGNVEVLKVLLAYGADPNAVNHVGETPLHKACRNGNPDIARTLIEAGGKVMIRNEEGQTPLHLAAGRGNIDDIYNTFGKDVFKNNPGFSVEDRKEENNRYLNVVKVLIEKGAQKNALDNNNKTPLDVAKANRKEELVYFLDC